jgi:hypothetical protein
MEGAAAMADLRDEKLDFWLKNNLNVLFIGHAGVGKTTRVIQAFERNGLKWKYFSASTMDPWCDFIGIPKVVSTPDGGSHLEFILPRDFQNDEVEAIFLDEFNRSHRKVRNAVMELIQFRSINGRKFKKLRVVWAAINPEEDDDYQVEPLDRAQKDRFHVHFHVPYKPSADWFHHEFPERLARAALEWWKELPAEMKKEVTPRRLEYALRVYQMKGGEMKDVLPHGCNVSKLITIINNGPASEMLKEFFDQRDTEGARKYLAVENNYASAAKHLVSPSASEKNGEWLGFFLPLLPTEKISALITEHEVVAEHVLAHGQEVPVFHRVMSDILEANQNKRLVRRIKKILGDNKSLAGQFGHLKNAHPEPPFFNKDSAVNWSAQITTFMTQPMDKTPQRMKVYAEILALIPEKLTAQQAVDTLELLNIVVGRCWPETIKDDLRNVMGVVNHCIDQLHRATNLSWVEILNLHGEKFEKMLRKLQEARMEDRLLCPTAKQSISDLVLERTDDLTKVQIA